MEDGEVREPIVAWGDTIIDGHNRWAIIQKHPEIPYKVKQMNFVDKWDAVAWMCRNQLGRRNLTKEQIAYIICQEYEAQSKTVGAPIGNENAKKQFGANHQIVSENKNPKTTREIIAESHGISQHEVKKSVEFGRGLDEAEKISPGIKNSVLSGEIKAPQKTISEIRRLPDEKKVEAVEAIKRETPFLFIRQFGGVTTPTPLILTTPEGDRTRAQETIPTLIFKKNSDLLTFFVDTIKMAKSELAHKVSENKKFNAQIR